MNELRKIEARKKEREKKTQDLQKLITAADNQSDNRKAEKKITKKKLQHPSRPRTDGTVSFPVIVFDLRICVWYVRTLILLTTHSIFIMLILSIAKRNRRFLSS